MIELSVKTLLRAVLLLIGVFVLYLLITLLLAPKTEAQAYPEFALKAKDTYKFNCIMCHGKYGEGNGPTVHALPVNPPDWSNPNWQRSVTDDGIRLAIVNGGKFVGRSDYMPPHPQLANSKEELQELVKLIREFGREL